MMNVLNFCPFFQYDVPTCVGILEEEAKDEIMETDVPSEGIYRPVTTYFTYSMPTYLYMYMVHFCTGYYKM